MTYGYLFIFVLQSTMVKKLHFAKEYRIRTEYNPQRIDQKKRLLHELFFAVNLGVALKYVCVCVLYIVTYPKGSKKKAH